MSAAGTPATPATSPWLVRLTAPAGPAVPRLVERDGAAVAAVPGRYCVTYLILGPEGIVVVDLGSHGDHALVLDALARLSRSPAEVRAVIPTHLHMDHIIGLDAFARRLGAPVLLGRVAHEAVTRGRRLRFPRGLHTLRAAPTYLMQGAPRATLQDWRVGLGFGFPWSQNRFRARLAPPLDHGAELPGAPGWTVLHTPGHADDAICLHHAGARLLIAGDTARNFNGGEWNPLGCDAAAYEQTQAQLRALAVEVVFPGHGPLIEGPRALQTLRHLPPYLP